MYTAGMPAAGAERRRTEVAADAFDHASWADGEGLARRTVVTQALVAFALGTPSDVVWRVGLGRRGLNRASASEASIAALVVLGLVVALPVAAFFGFLGRDWMLESGGSRWASFATFLAAIAGTLLFIGLGMFDRRPASGATLIALCGVCVAISLWWSPAAVALGGTACVSAIAAARWTISHNAVDN